MIGLHSHSVLAVAQVTGRQQHRASVTWIILGYQLLLLRTLISSRLCYLDLYGTMNLLWYSTWYLGPQHREANHVRGESLNDCGAKLYIQSAPRLLGYHYCTRDVGCTF